MTPLRQRMLQDMGTRNLAVNTQLAYVQQISAFARHFDCSPEALGPEQVRTYQVYNAMAPLQDAQAFKQFLAPAASAEWVVYAKAPLAGPEQVLEYLGRYTHRVAISNSRLVEFSDSSVAFRWKDYRHDSMPKVMRLPAAEFTRRFLLHVLPSGLQRICRYGLLANRTREAKLERCRELLGVTPPPPNEQDPDDDYRDHYLRLTGMSLVDCPACKHGRMVCIETLLPRPPSQGPPDGHRWLPVPQSAATQLPKAKTVEDFEHLLPWRIAIADHR